MVRVGPALRVVMREQLAAHLSNLGGIEANRRCLTLLAPDDDSGRCVDQHCLFADSHLTKTSLFVHGSLSRQP